MENAEFVLLKQVVIKLTTWHFRWFKINVQTPVFFNYSHLQGINGCDDTRF